MVSNSRATLLGLLVSGMFVAQPAAATPFTVTAWAPAGYAGVNIKNTDPHPVNPTTYNGQGGGFVMTDTAPGGLGSFISWCVDIYQVIPGNVAQPYDVDAGGLATFNATTVNDLGRLATLALTAATTPGAGNNAAAFQLAVWEIVFEHTTLPYNLATGSGNFFWNAPSSTAYATAQGWLTALNNDPNSANNYSIIVFKSGTYQDQVTFKSVPEPATLGLLGLGLISIGFARRKSIRGQTTKV